MKRQDFRLHSRLRVRWAEVDMQKIVFNAHYLMYFDTAMGEYWRAVAFPYQDAIHSLDGDLYLKKASVEYHASAEMDDQIDVCLRCERIGNSSMQFVGGIFRDDRLLVSGELIYVFADPATQTSKPVHPGLRDLCQAFEAGEPAVHVRVGSWAQLGADAAAVRTRVFVEEQKIPKEMEWDEADATAQHAVAYNRMGLPVATGRLLQHAEGVGRIGRMAVLRALRGSNLGRDILAQLTLAARARGDAELMLHAQASALGFYRRLGWVPHGDAFDEVGIPHQEMRLLLRAEGPQA